MPCGNRHRTCRRRGRGKSAGPGCRTAGGSGITGRRRCRRQVGQPDAIDTPEGANRLLDLIADRMSSPLRPPKTTKIPAPSCFRRSPYSSGWSRCARRRHGNMPTPSERSSRSFGRLSRHAGRVSTRTASSTYARCHRTAGVNVGFRGFFRYELPPRRAVDQQGWRRQLLLYPEVNSPEDMKASGGCNCEVQGT